MTRDIPIIYSAPMVRGLIDGLKTKTRRVAWQKRRGIKKGPMISRYNPLLQSPWAGVKPGDRLWVRETWSAEHIHAGNPPRNITADDTELWYWADGNPAGGDWTRPIPSIHMPRWASRITLTVTNVRIECLHDISDDEAIAEGIVRIDRSVARHGRLDGYGAPGTPPADASPTPHQAFARLWSDLHSSADWEANPEVVVLTFLVALGNIDASKAMEANAA